MKKNILIVLAIITCLSLLTCGNSEEQASIERREQYLKEQEKKNEPPSVKPEDLTLGPEILAENVIPGTCAEAAIKFATAFSDIDTLTALSMVSDTLKILVRTLMTREDQVKRMLQAKEMGFKIKAVKMVQDIEDTSLCQACVTALINGMDVDDCSFRFMLEDGRWILYDFGSY